MKQPDHIQDHLNAAADLLTRADSFLKTDPARAAEQLDSAIAELERAEQLIDEVLE